MPKAPRKTQRNPELIRGLVKFGRSHSYHSKGIWALKKRASPPKKTIEKTKTITKPFGKKGEKRTVTVPKSPSFYPAEDVHKPLPRRKTEGPARLRKSITPGTVLILLAGKHQGKRVVFLKQLPSGCLLVTGPYKLNGVPLRRYQQSYVIATSTRVDISGIKIDDKFNDDYFRKKHQPKKKTEEQFFAQETKEKQPIDQAKAADQKSFDKPLLDIVKKTPLLAKYLSTPFSLRPGVAPHTLKF